MNFRPQEKLLLMYWFEGFSWYTVSQAYSMECTLPSRIVIELPLCDQKI